MTSKIRPNENPSWCSDRRTGSRVVPLTTAAGRRPTTIEDEAVRLIDTCYATHHLQFDNDPDQTVWLQRAHRSDLRWIDTKVYDQTKNEQMANGWCGQVLDTNGDGRITRPWNRQVTGVGGSVLYQSDTGGVGAPAATAPGAPAASAGSTAFNPKLDTLLALRMYSVIPSPVDDTVWGVSEQYPGYLIRLQRGANPPSTCKTLVFKVPEPGSIRAASTSTATAWWTALAASNHLASFDVRGCRTSATARPTAASAAKGGAADGRTEAEGDRRAGGLPLLQLGGPARRHGVWREHAHGDRVELRLILVLNRGTVGGSRCACLAPLGFYSRGMDAHRRSEGGMKGRGLWANHGRTSCDRGRQGDEGKLVHFQIQPDARAVVST